MFLKLRRKELEWGQRLNRAHLDLSQSYFFVRVIRIHYKSQVNFFQIQILKKGALGSQVDYTARIKLQITEFRTSTLVRVEQLNHGHIIEED